MIVIVKIKSQRKSVRKPEEKAESTKEKGFVEGGFLSVQSVFQISVPDPCHPCLKKIPSAKGRTGLVGLR